MTERDALRQLELETHRARSVRAYARLIDVPQQTVAAVLARKRPLNDEILRRLGIRRVVTYEPRRGSR